MRVLHVVEEDRAALRVLDEPLVIAVRAGERPAHVARQHAVEDLLVELCGGDPHELPFAARVAVQLGRDQALAGARAADDRHRGPPPRKPRDARSHISDVLAGPDQRRGLMVHGSGRAAARLHRLRQANVSRENGLPLRVCHMTRSTGRVCRDSPE